MKRNHFLWGVLLGAIAPALAALFTEIIGIHLSKPVLLYMLAAMVNLLLLRYFYRNEQEKSARGVMLLTFAGAIVVLFTRSVI